MPSKNATVRELQKYIKQTLAARGFDDETIEQKYLLFTEEVGELAKAIRQSSDSIKSSVHSKSHALLEEAGDVFILFLDICNKLGIDAEEALRYKEAINAKRNWK